MCFCRRPVAELVTQLQWCAGGLQDTEASLLEGTGGAAAGAGGKQHIKQPSFLCFIPTCFFSFSDFLPQSLTFSWRSQGQETKWNMIHTWHDILGCFSKKSRCYWITAAEKYSQLTFLAGKQETAISGAHSSPLLYSGDCLRLYDNANLTRWLLLSAPSQKNVVLSASLNLYIEYWKSVMEATHNSVPTEPAAICGALPFTSGYSESISEEMWDGGGGV